MHFGFALELSNVDLLDTHLDLLDTDIPSKYFAFLHNVFKTSSRPTNVFWGYTSLRDFFPFCVFTSLQYF